MVINRIISARNGDGIGKAARSDAGRRSKVDRITRDGNTSPITSGYVSPVQTVTFSSRKEVVKRLLCMQLIFSKSIIVTYLLLNGYICQRAWFFFYVKPF